MCDPHFVCPSLSLSVNDLTSKDENRTFIDFIWKNIAKNLMGLEILDCVDTVNTFKVKWLRKCF